MVPRPIFDTNIFGHVEEGLISHSDWRHLLRQRAGRGWPLSAVTALELLVGVHDVPPEKFPRLRKQVELAWRLSNGRILEEPRFLLCKEVLRVPFPPDLVPPSAAKLAQYMDVVRRARSRQDILEGCVPYKGGWAGLHDTSVLNELVAGPKKEWAERVEALADDIYPPWRELFQQTGKRLPPEMRKELASRSAWEAERNRLSESMLRWLNAGTARESVAEITKRLDAVLEFTLFVVREFLTGSYSLERHGSDVYDQFQLHYLAIDRFIIVSEDTNLSKRTSRSCQVDRIMSFEKFLQNL